MYDGCWNTFKQSQIPKSGPKAKLCRAANFSAPQSYTICLHGQMQVAWANLINYFMLYKIICIYCDLSCQFSCSFFIRSPFSLPLYIDSAQPCSLKVFIEMFSSHFGIFCFNIFHRFSLLKLFPIYSAVCRRLIESRQCPMFFSFSFLFFAVFLSA